MTVVITDVKIWYLHDSVIATEMQSLLYSLAVLDVCISHKPMEETKLAARPLNFCKTLE